MVPSPTRGEGVRNPKNSGAEERYGPLPPCGGGIGWGGPRPRSRQPSLLRNGRPPTPPLPHKGGGSQKSEKQWRRGTLWSPPPLWGRDRVGGPRPRSRQPSLLRSGRPLTPPLPHKGGGSQKSEKHWRRGTLWSPPPLWGRDRVGGPGLGHVSRAYFATADPAPHPSPRRGERVRTRDGSLDSS